jgi:hypothetical protein
MSVCRLAAILSSVAMGGGNLLVLDLGDQTLGQPGLFRQLLDGDLPFLPNAADFLTDGKFTQVIPHGSGHLFLPTGVYYN